MGGWLEGAEAVLTAHSLTMILAGVLLGMLVGAIPGFSATMAVAVLVPFTFTMEPLPGLMMLLGVTASAMYSGAIPAILINVPGTPGAAATTIDGYQMAKQGRARQALTISLMTSVVAGIVSVVLLGLMAPMLARVALMFGPAEMFMLCLFSLTVIVSVSGGVVIRGIICALLGVAFSTVGLDPIQAYARFSFHSAELTSGIQYIPVMIGLFGVAEAFKQYERIRRGSGDEVLDLTGRYALTKKEWRALAPTTWWSTLIGFVVGVMPGAGGTIGSFVAYSETKRFARDKSRFGKGDPRGVASSEAANNSSISGALGPMLTLGIPGDGVTAILIGALTVHGLNPGPELFETRPDLVYGLFVGLIVAYVILTVVGLVGVKGWSRISLIPPRILWPVIVLLCVVGSYTLRNNPFDILVMTVAGVIGYILLKADYPIIALVIGLVLGPIMESSYRRSMIIEHGSFGWIVKPLPFCLLLLALAALFLPAAMRFIKARRTSAAGEKVESPVVHVGSERTDSD
ncbi:tripartite tricarboxylate transporter permease [Mycobacterium sp. 21AC1]|uniref:tripartite tricarboxylate transporter permease n=1 Tax=[Mycobacterium] appelbergii TaxID=2939269 RepID=UPI00293916C0|nr:tripartite tricarboxylate transporter permease [Mycobacterium sp. 21AC1]MDV3127258.1 tripartite tricarboxylate transporter permease [Mycobacterium sp. 21AC1]